MQQQEVLAVIQEAVERQAVAAVALLGLGGAAADEAVEQELGHPHHGGGRGRQGSQRLEPRVALAALLQDLLVEGSLAREVLEHQRLRHRGGLRDLLGRRPGKAVPCEQRHRRLDNGLPPPLEIEASTRHPCFRSLRSAK